nr:reverse transcriptase domain-containing protein [Tanacetum cinerariifolium]
HLSKQVLIEELKEKSINEVEILAVVEEEEDKWITPIFKYLEEGILPADMKKARAVRRPLQANYILREIHEGSCSMHAAEEALKQMKQLIAELPMLTTPMEKEELIVYLATVKEMVSAVLMMEREAKQMPIYFVSRALREEDSPDTLIEMEEELPEPDGSGAGLILTSPEGMEFTYALRFIFEATNNEVEYEALIAGLRIAKQMGIKNLQANVDSCLVANQVNRTYVAKEVDMIHYLGKVRRATSSQLYSKRDTRRVL